MWEDSFFFVSSHHQTSLSKVLRVPFKKKKKKKKCDNNTLSTGGVYTMYLRES